MSGVRFSLGVCVGAEEDEEEGGLGGNCATLETPWRQLELSYELCASVWVWS